jgi:hypothetical protein
MSEPKDRAPFLAWQQANPELTKRIRDARNKLTEINSLLLDDLCDRIEEVDNPFAAKELVEDAGRLMGCFNQLNTTFGELGGHYD